MYEQPMFTPPPYLHLPHTPCPHLVEDVLEVEQALARGDLGQQLGLGHPDRVQEGARGTDVIAAVKGRRQHQRVRGKGRMCAVLVNHISSAMWVRLHADLPPFDSRRHSLSLPPFPPL